MRAMPSCIGGNSPVSRKVLAIDSMLQIPQPDVLEEHTHRRQPAQHGAPPTIEKTEPQDIHAEKARGRPHQNISEVRAAAALGQFFRTPGGVAIQLFEMMRQIPIGHVHQRGAQAPDVGAALEVLVHAALYITPIALEQAHNRIVSAAAVALVVSTLEPPSATMTSSAHVTARTQSAI